MDPTNQRTCGYYFTPKFCIYNLVCVFVWGLMGWGLYVYNYIYCIHVLWDYPVTSSIFLVGFNLFWVLMLISHLRTVFTDPGSVPYGYTPQGVDPEAPDLSATGRYCQKCQNYKPERTHHCSICKRCVLKMDHHCPWVNNCVGWRNYKFFMLFLFYTVTTCTWCSFTLLPSVLQHGLSNLAADGIQILVLMIIAMCFALALSCFTLHHINLVLKNATTIESFEASRRGNPYNVGKLNNWKQVFGPSPWLWFIPVANMMGNGLSFPRTDINNEIEQSVNARAPFSFRSLHNEIAPTNTDSHYYEGSRPKSPRSPPRYQSRHGTDDTLPLNKNY